MDNHIIEATDTTRKKPEIEQSANSSNTLVRTIISLVLYTATYYFLFGQNLHWILLLVAVMLFHEAGHFAAMKLFGYRDVQMFFVPFIGAFVSGAPDTISQKQRTITLLAGPLPGILAGVIFLILHYYTGNNLYYQLSLMLILLNAFNLLPVTPLDGGQLVENLFLYPGRIVQAAFIVISALLLFYLAVVTRNYFVLLIVWLLISRFRNMIIVNTVRKALEKDGISYETTYEELSDESYFEIRKRMILHVKKLSAYDPDHISDDEAYLIEWMNRILTGNMQKDMNANEKLAVTVLWIIALIVPFFLFIDQRFSIHSWFYR